MKISLFHGMLLLHQKRLLWILPIQIISIWCIFDIDPSDLIDRFLSILVVFFWWIMVYINRYLIGKYLVYRPVLTLLILNISYVIAWIFLFTIASILIYVFGLM